MARRLQLVQKPTKEIPKRWVKDKKDVARMVGYPPTVVVSNNPLTVVSLSREDRDK